MAQIVEVVPGELHPLVASAGESVVYRETFPLAGSYASVEDLDEISVPEGSEGDWGTTLKERWLRIASRLLDSHVGQRWRVPLTKFSEAWIWAVCEVAFAGMCGKRGYRPGGEGQKTVGQRRDDAVEWVKMAKNYEVTPDPALVLSEPAPVAQMRSDVPRGWGGTSPSDVAGGRGYPGRRGFFRG